MYGKKREILLVVCKCGRIKRKGSWVWIQTSFSDFLAMALEQDVFAFEFPIGICDVCQKNERVALHH